MAIPSLPLAILDACTATNSIARGVDGNATPPKTLYTLGTTAGKTAGGVYMSEFVGYSADKTVTMSTYQRVGTCGTEGPVEDRSCLANSPAMVSGDRYDATISYLLKNDSGTMTTCIIIKRNTTILFQTSNTSVGNVSSTYVVQDVSPTDVIHSCVYALASSIGSVGCACSTLTALTDKIQSGFIIGSPSSNFVVAVKNF